LTKIGRRRHSCSAFAKSRWQTIAQDAAERVKSRTPEGGQHPVRPAFSRRAFLVGLGAGGGLALLSACSAGPPVSPTSPPASSASPAAGAAPIGTAEKSSLKTTQAASTLAFVQVNIGRARGLFKDEGLEVEQISTGGGGPDLQALIAGEADFTIGAGTYQTDAFKQGRRILNVFNTLDKNVVNFAMHVDVARERGLTEKTPFKDKLAALKGLKIGGTRPGALTYQQAEYLVRLAGLTPQQDAEVVAAGEGPALIAALESRQIDVMCQTVPVAEQAVARGKAILFINNAAGEDPSLVPFNMENVFTRPEFAQQNPNTVARFVRATKRANDFILATSPTDLAAAVRGDEFFKSLDLPVLEAGFASIKAATNRTGILDRKAVENQVKMQNITDLDLDKVYGLFTDVYIKRLGA
jgi:NitT/TauT family transport system substrate-binding protein